MMAGPFALSAALLIQPFALAGANKMAGPSPIKWGLPQLPEGE